MGFAGQVFAARVAIGLAIPSPSAFSNAGEQIGKFASNIYSGLHQQNVDQSKKSAGVAQKNLTEAQQRLASHLKNQDSELLKNSEHAINTLSSQFAKLGKQTQMSHSRLVSIAKGLPKPVKSQLFKNVNKDLNDADRYKQVMTNFMELSKEQRQLTLQSMDAESQALKSQINTEEKRAAMKPKQLAAIKNQIALRKEEKDQFEHLHKIRVQLETATGAKKKKLLAEQAEAEKKLLVIERELEANQRKAAQATREWGQSVGRFAGQVKQNFNDALRESIGVLTAFYYKLQQNTQGLMEFERELMNANSVFRITNDELFQVGNTIVEFGQQFGMEMQNGATGLYQLASAGLTANEAMELLPHTLKLSMAVQGDHNTISKLTAQTLFGFGMEMNQAAEVTDKFAHAIQKSLIEYEDLSSAVKFALPFFTTTGQSIDQLLGALAVLTNRALEAGIAGRGLRQGLAELAESVGDNTAAFRKLGVEVTNEQGEMLQLTEIAANFATVLEEGVINDTELLTTLIEDLNVRGATAFVHLVQASDEFTAAVKSSEEAGGELDEMVKIQNASLTAQIQILKNNVEAIFTMRDASYEGTEFMNGFHEAVINGVASLKGLIVEGEEGSMVLTALGKNIQEAAITGVEMLVDLLEDLIPLIKDFVKEGGLNVELLKVYAYPLKVVVGLIDILGANFVKLIIAWNIIGKMLPIQQAGIILLSLAYDKLAASQVAATFASNGFKAAFAATPWGRIIVGTLLVGGALYAVGKNMDTVKNIGFGIWKMIEHVGKAIIWVFSQFKAFGNYIGTTFSDEWFTIGKFFSHLFLMMSMEWQSIVGWTLKFLAVFALLASPAGPLLATLFIIKKIADYFDVGEKSKAWAGRRKEQVKGWLGRADGGMVQPRYAADGAFGSARPYIVGERGPELFMPNAAGRIVPNKDLNTQRVKNMLQDAFATAPRQGAAGIGQAQTLIVSSLNVGSADLRKTKLGVDVFG